MSASLLSSAVKNQSVPKGATPTKALRPFLFTTAAITGGAVMIVEILGARMLSPYVGTSHFVWTAQIAVTLVALACGYYFGGRLADRARTLVPLYSAITAAALWMAMTIAIIEPVAYWALDFSLPVGTLLASAILFFVPLSLLAMTGPYLAAKLTSSLQGVGGSVGRLTAVSTLGSFAGTMLIGYVLIPLLSNATSMYLTAALLIMVCAASFLFSRQKGALVVPIILGLVSTLIIFPQLVSDHRYTWVKELYRGNSHFGLLQVLDRLDGSTRYYLNDNLIQNTYAPEQKQSASAFTYMLSGLARAYTTNIQDALCIGLGIGIVPRDFARGGAKVDVVEINPGVVPVATGYFDFDKSAVNLVIDDGRHFLNGAQKKYDAVALDAFLGDSSPAHLMTREAFESIRRALKPGGVLVINSFAEREPGRNYFAASLKNTLQSVFQGVRMHSNSDGAIFWVATDHPDPQFVHPPDTSGVHPDARDQVEVAFRTLVDTASKDGIVLTDNYNPVEFFDASNREAVRRRLAEMARRM